MELFIGLTLTFALIIAANLIVKSARDNYRHFFDRFILLISLPIFIYGVFFVIMPEAQLAELLAQPDLFADPMLMGVLFQVMAIWGIVFSLRSTREYLARFLAVDPDSSVHTLALVLAGWFAGFVLIQVSQTDIEQIIESIGTLDILSIVLQEALFVVIALLGVGLFIRRNFQGVLQRLGLGRVNGRDLLIGVGWIILLIIIQSLAGILWTVISPEQAELVNELNLDSRVGLDTVWEWFLLALAAGIGEEILFRGALQKVFGLWATAVLFAIIHVQYGFLTPATLALFIIGFSLGLIRRNHNTTLAIFVHFGYDFSLGIMALLLANFDPAAELGVVICRAICDLL
jgi:membrane protease YdiL (CAAX protease family)